MKPSRRALQNNVREHMHLQARDDIRLDADESHAFAAQLLEPCEPNSRLRAAAARFLTVRHDDPDDPDR